MHRAANKKENVLTIGNKKNVRRLLAFYEVMLPAIQNWETGTRIRIGAMINGFSLLWSLVGPMSNTYFFALRAAYPRTNQEYSGILFVLNPDYCAMSISTWFEVFRGFSVRFVGLSEPNKRFTWAGFRLVRCCLVLNNLTGSTMLARSFAKICFWSGFWGVFAGFLLGKNPWNSIVATKESKRSILKGSEPIISFHLNESKR